MLRELLERSFFCLFFIIYMQFYPFTIPYRVQCLFATTILFESTSVNTSLRSSFKHKGDLIRIWFSIRISANKYCFHKEIKYFWIK